MQEQPNDATTYLTVKDISERLQVHEQTVRRYIKSGALPALEIGGSYRVSPQDFQVFLNKHKKAPETKE